MKLPKIRKDCQVEVRSEEEGLEGAWFRAILEENPTKWERKKLRVRYLTLLHEDGSSPLIEKVAPRLIRPVPPENQYDGVVLEEGSVVDADHKDGWWTGVVIKKLDKDQFLVYYDSIPNILQFERKHLRAHFDWTGSKWVQPHIKELSKSLFSSGAMVEVSYKLEAVWVPALLVKEIDQDGDNKFIVKFSANKSFSCDGDEVKPNTIVDACNVRPIPPPSFVETYELLDRVDAFHGFGWRQGLVKGVLFDKHYLVSFTATAMNSKFKHSQLRPSKQWEDGDAQWEDGVWHQGPKGNTEKETPPVAFVLPLAQESSNQMADAPQVIPIEQESAPPVTPVIKATPLKEREAESQGSASPEKTLQPNRMQNGLEREKMSEEHNSEDNTRKRKREQKHDSNLNEDGEACNGSKAQIADTHNDICDDVYDLGENSFTRSAKSKLTRDQSPNAVKNSTADETGGNKDKIMVLPFVKHSAMWKALESMEVFKAVKQNPHFSPLLETREELRECLALGVMVKFSWLFERVEDLQIHVLKSTLETLKEGFLELETYGFDVTAPISRIDMLLSLKDKHANTVEELEDKEKEMTEGVIKMQKVEEVLRDAERKILELQSQKAVLNEKKVASEKEKDALGKEIAQTQLCASVLDKTVQDVELEFQSIVSAPW